MVRKNAYHFCVFVETILFKAPIPLKTQFHIPQRPKGIRRGKIQLVTKSMAFWEPPELHKRSHKLDLVALSANMSQTDNQVILKQALNDNVPIDSGKVEVDRQSIYHI